MVWAYRGLGICGHIMMCALFGQGESERGPRSFPEISLKLDHFSHNLLAVSLIEDVTWLSLPVGYVHSVITHWVLSMSQGLG